MNTILEFLAVSKDLAIIGGILYVVYKIAKFSWPQPDKDSKSKDKDFYYEKAIERSLVDKERKFLKANVNVDENYRTTTFTQAIIQSLKTSRLVEELQLRNEITSINNQQSNFTSFELPAECPIPGEDDCDFHDISDNELELIDARNITYLAGIIGVETLNEICLCPDGRYCDWTAKMFEKFLVNTNEWNVSEISVYKCNGDLGTATLIAFADIDNVKLGPLEDFAVVKMNEIEGMLTGLNGGDVIKAKFTWIDSNGNTRCVILRNIIPFEQTTDPGSGSGFTTTNIDITSS